MKEVSKQTSNAMKAKNAGAVVDELFLHAEQSGIDIRSTNNSLSDGSSSFSFSFFQQPKDADAKESTQKNFPSSSVNKESDTKKTIAKSAQPKEVKIASREVAWEGGWLPNDDEVVTLLRVVGRKRF